MSRRTAHTEPTASVNLLSPWVFEDLRVHRLRRRFLAAAVALIVVVALGWMAQRINLHQAEQELRGEEAVTNGLTRQIDDLEPVRTYVDGVARRRTVVQGAMLGDVAFSRVLSGLDEVTPEGATIESIAVSLPTAGAEGAEPSTVTAPEITGKGAAKARARQTLSMLFNASCPGPDPFGTRIIVGCVALEGTAADRETVGELVIALGDNRLFVEPFISTTTTSDSSEVSFSGSVGLSANVFSGRYDDLGSTPAPEGE